MPKKPPTGTQADTIAALLERSKRAEVPIRKTFAQQGTRKVPDPGQLAARVSHHDESAPDLYLPAHAAASAEPFDVALAASAWVRALGMAATDSVYKKAQLSPHGYTEDRHYTLRAPIGPLCRPIGTVTKLSA